MKQPFAACIQLACRSLQVFKPTNPWVATIMSLLAEIHGLEKVKLNITFEIEIICQNMGLKVTDLKPSTELKGRKVSAKLSTIGSLHQARQKAVRCVWPCAGSV